MAEPTPGSPNAAYFQSQGYTIPAAAPTTGWAAGYVGSQGTASNPTLGQHAAPASSTGSGMAATQTGGRTTAAKHTVRTSVGHNYLRP